MSKLPETSALASVQPILNVLVVASTSQLPSVVVTLKSTVTLVSPAVNWPAIFFKNLLPTIFPPTVTLLKLLNAVMVLPPIVAVFIISLLEPKTYGVSQFNILNTYNRCLKNRINTKIVIFKNKLLII